MLLTFLGSKFLPSPPLKTALIILQYVIPVIANRRIVSLQVRQFSIFVCIRCKKGLNSLPAEHRSGFDSLGTEFCF
jgi:hypothetical protein